MKREKANLIKKEKSSRRPIFIGVFFFLLLSTNAFADTFKTQAGEILEGEVLEEDAHYFYLNTSSGVVKNVRKIDLATRNDQPYAGGAAVPKQISPEGNLPRGKNKNDGVKLAQADTVVHPSGVTEGQLRAYYDAHKEEFRLPVEVRLNFIAPGVVIAAPEKVLQDPYSSKAWKDTGWVKKGASLNVPFSTAEYNQIFGLRKGQTLRIDLKSKGTYLFWVTDRKESSAIPYAQARPQVLTRMLQKKT